MMSTRKIRPHLRASTLAILASVTCVACGERSAPAPAVGTPTTVATPAPVGSSTPSFVVAADGAALLSWTERLADSSVAIRVAAWRNGQWDSTRTISAARAFFVNWADFPSVTALNNGDIAAHWLHQHTTTLASHVRI